MSKRLLQELFSSQKELYGSSFFRDKALAIIKENLRQDFENEKIILILDEAHKCTIS